METMVTDLPEEGVGGFLAGFLKRQGVVRGADLISLLNLVFGADLINQGVLLEGLRIWRRVAKWGASEIGLAKKLADPDRLTNAIAEQYFGAFDGEGAYGLPVFVAGAILGENAAKISSFYEEAGKFLTRVVGLRYGGRSEVVDELTAGDEVLLIWEQENPYDPKALRVITQKGQDLGFIRRPIAHKLVARIKGGAALRAKVELVLSEQYDINERVWVKVLAS